MHVASGAKGYQIFQFWINFLQIQYVPVDIPLEFEWVGTGRETSCHHGHVYNVNKTTPLRGYADLDNCVDLIIEVSITENNGFYIHVHYTIHAIYMYCFTDNILCNVLEYLV